MINTNSPLPFAASHGDSVEAAYAGALRDTLSQMPYNSATAFHDHSGVSETPPELGAACILQTHDVARRATERGAPPAVLLQDERHVAAVFHDEAGVVVLDPYILHIDPIRFSKSDIAVGFATTTVDAVPMRRDKQGQVRPARLAATYKTTSNGYVIRLSYSKFSPTQDKYVLSRHFSLRSDSFFHLETFTRDMTGLLTDPEQTSVSIRAVLVEQGRTAEAILPLRDFASRQFTAADIWLRDSQGRMQANQWGSNVWQDLESATGHTGARIADYLVEAGVLYQALADPAQHLASYPVVDE